MTFFLKLINRLCNRSIASFASFVEETIKVSLESLPPPGLCRSIKTTADSLEGPRRYKQCRPTTAPLSAVRLLNQCVQELLQPGPEQLLSPYPNQLTKSKSRSGAAILIARNPTLQTPTLQSLMSPRHQTLLVVTCRLEP